jgi:hypothetical protein
MTGLERYEYRDHGGIASCHVMGRSEWEYAEYIHCDMVF